MLTAVGVGTLYSSEPRYLLVDTEDTTWRLLYITADNPPIRRRCFHSREELGASVKDESDPVILPACYPASSSWETAGDSATWRLGRELHTFHNDAPTKDHGIIM